MASSQNEGRFSGPQYSTAPSCKDPKREPNLENHLYRTLMVPFTQTLLETLIDPCEGPLKGSLV